MIRYALALLALLPDAAGAALSERDLAQAVARPPAGAVLPAKLAFTDGNGRRVTLGSVAAGRPSVLIFADYTCRHICSPGLALTAQALGATGLTPGRDYALTVIGIDPRDTAADARHLLAGAAPAAIARTATLLTGDAATVAAATRALGYGFVHDPANDQFAHDAMLYVFAADGRMTALLPEMGLRAPALRAALAAPAPAATEGFADRVAHLCYGFATAHGRFDRPVAWALRTVTALLVAGLVLLLWRRRAGGRT